jgi:hypothetical protein
MKVCYTSMSVQTNLRTLVRAEAQGPATAG